MIVAMGSAKVTAGTARNGVASVGLTPAGALHSKFNAGALRLQSLTEVNLFPQALAVDGSYNMMVAGYTQVAGIRKGFVSRYVNGVEQAMAGGSTVQRPVFKCPPSGAECAEFELFGIARTPTGRFVVAGHSYASNSTSFRVILAELAANGLFITDFDGDGMDVAPLYAVSSDSQLGVIHAGDLTEEVVGDLVLTSNARMLVSGTVRQAARGDEAFALVHDVEPGLVRFDVTTAATPPWVNSYLLARLSDVIYLDDAVTRKAELQRLGAAVEVKFINNTSTDAQALVARTSSALFVVVRGTESLNDVGTDFLVVWNDTVTHSASVSGFPTYHRLWKYYGNLLHVMPSSLHY